MQEPELTDSSEILTNVDSSQVAINAKPDSLTTIVETFEQTNPTFFEKLFTDPLLPLVAVAIFFLFALFVVYKRLADSVDFIIKNDNTLSASFKYDQKEKLSSYIATVKTLRIIIPLFLAGYLLYVAVHNTNMQGYVMEWLNLFVRWAHVVVGIMWIGASFYFIFLENNLNRTKGIRDELAGNLWAIHGGGFYFLEKYKVAPKAIPKDLHWFKYEAYFTWISGFTLLTIVYYMDAKAYLIDPSVAELPVATAIGIGVGTLILGWVVYDQLCKSPLVKRPNWFALVGFLLLVGVAYFLTHIFNSRAAYIHFGALLGTMMAWNVYFTIIPAQKALVKAATLGEPLDATLGKKAGERSLHNNYFTLPVIFIMISNHFPSTFGHAYNWAVLMVIALASAGIKHYWNLLERGKTKTYILVVSVIALLSLALVTSPAFEERIDMAIPVTFEEAKAVIDLRCIQCHSANPTDDVWTAAPNGVMYDTPEQIKNMSDKIMARAVRSKTMPQGNKTNMTDAERLVLKRWIMQGAKIE